MKIRIGKFSSEDSSYSYTVVHPDDEKWVFSEHDRSVEAFRVAPPDLKRENWKSYLDVEDAGRDGDPLADEYCRWERQYKKDTFEVPIWVNDPEATSSWPWVGYNPMVKKEGKQ
jgi:hypothetical protein